MGNRFLYLILALLACGNLTLSTILPFERIGSDVQEYRLEQESANLPFTLIPLKKDLTKFTESVSFIESVNVDHSYKPLVALAESAFGFPGPALNSPLPCSPYRGQAPPV